MEDLTRLETDRLILRPFTEADEPLILAIASDPDTVRYLYYWGRDGITPEKDARRFLAYALKNWRKEPIRAREYCLVRKADGVSIGDGSLEWVADQPGAAEIGWILEKSFRGRGYATEMARELLGAGFRVMGAERIIAHCDQRNPASQRVMERLGMRLLCVEAGARPAKAPGEAPGDECTYQITRDEWMLDRAMAEYRQYSCFFGDFVPLPQLTDGEIALEVEKLSPADPEKNYVPAYHFRITHQGRTVGAIDLRVGYPETLFYAGQIGYSVEEAYRGRGYAGAACRLLIPVMRAHRMKTALITNSVTNPASRRVCEKLGARLLCRCPVPPGHDMHAHGVHEVNVFALDAD